MSLYAYLLHHANTKIQVYREDFYDLKKTLLEAHAVTDGYDMQHIRDVCYACEGEGSFAEDYNDDTDMCQRCMGTGLYNEQHIPLRRYRYDGYFFHIPTPLGNQDDVTYVHTINGRISHTPSPYADEACLWLFFLLRPFFFFKIFGKSAYTRPYHWFHPMVSVNNSVFRIRTWLYRKKMQRTLSHYETPPMEDLPF